MTTDLREEIENNIAEIKARDEEVATETPVQEPVEQPTEQPAERPEELEPVKEINSIPAPQAWTAPMKEKWSAIPPDVQAEILRRESDMHKMVTSHEGELRIGKEMKAVLEPYMADIKESGAEPKALIADLLGTVKALRSGSEEQKIQIMRNIADGYGIDLTRVVQYQNDPMQQIYAKMNYLEQQLNPQNIMQQLQSQQEDGKVRAEIEAFAANPANKYFDQVKTLMGTLMDSGKAANLQEAYNSAIWSDPVIRAELIKSQDEERAQKKRQEVEVKQRASKSITGSPSILSGNPANPQDRTLREELEAQLSAFSSGRV